MTKIVEYCCCNLYDARGCKYFIVCVATYMMHVDVNLSPQERPAVRFCCNLYDARGCKYVLRFVTNNISVATYMMNVNVNMRINITLQSSILIKNNFYYNHV